MILQVAVYSENRNQFDHHFQKRQAHINLRYPYPLTTDHASSYDPCGVNCCQIDAPPARTGLKRKAQSATPAALPMQR